LARCHTGRKQEKYGNYEVILEDTKHLSFICILKQTKQLLLETIDNELNQYSKLLKNTE